MEYDVVIVGASFAGLAVASRVQGRVLVVDRSEVGAERTSACATAVSVLQALGCQSSLERVVHQIVIHLPGGRARFDLPEPYCTFDYQGFCRGLLERSGTEFLRARVLGAEPGLIHTDQGEVRARVLVDASGWRAVLARCWEGSWVDREALSLGLETDVPTAAEALNIWPDAIPVGRGVAWLFPGAEGSGAGVGSYDGSQGVRQGLANFLAARRLARGHLRGGFFPSQLRRAVADQVFVVGDAAGQCLPLTGEGIRPAVYFGLRCGELVQRVVRGHLSLEEALRRYEAQTERYRWLYRILESSQRWVPSLPSPCLSALVRLGSFPPLARAGLFAYLRAVSPRRLSRPEGLG